MPPDWRGHCREDALPLINSFPEKSPTFPDFFIPSSYNILIFTGCSRSKSSSWKTSLSSLAIYKCFWNEKAMKYCLLPKQ